MGIKKWLGLSKARVSPFVGRGNGQLDQDLWVVAELDGKRDGFFVEIGAFDGVDMSNTLLLERQYGWRGILAEPNPLMSDKIRAARTSPLCTQPVDAVSGREVTMLFIPESPELSAMQEHASKDRWAKTRKAGVPVTQTTISLNDLLDSHGAPEEIDYISIDTEGNEPDILSTFDFGRYRCRMFSIEHNGTGADKRLDLILLPKGYVRVHKTWSAWDAWYVKR